MKHLVLSLLLILIGCQKDSVEKKNAITTITKPTQAPQSHHYSNTIPADPSINIEEPDYIEEESNNKPDYSDTSRPIDLSNESYKGFAGAFIEIDILNNEELRFSARNGEDYLKFKLQADNRISCEKSWNLKDPNCSSNINTFVVTRTNPKKLDQQIQSILMPFHEVTFWGFNFKVDDKILGVSQYPCFSNRTLCRIHIIEPGQKTSIVIDDYQDKLTVSYLQLKNENGFKDIKEETIPINGMELLPVDFNYKELYFTMRGRYLNFSISDQWNNDYLIAFYNSPDFTLPPVFHLGLNGEIMEPGNRKCVKDANGRHNWNVGEKDRCNSDFEWINISFGTTNSMHEEFYLKFKEYNHEKDFVSIDYKDKTFYIDLSECKKKHTCTFVYYPETSYQNDLKKLSYFQKNKNFATLNDLKTSLDECVDKKNIECIKNHILSPEETYKSDEEGCIDDSVNVPSYSFVDKDIEELKECLKYENLLFHRLALKGKNKYCIFAPRVVIKEGLKKPMLLGLFDKKEIREDYRNYSYEQIIRLPPMSTKELAKLEIESN